MTNHVTMDIQWIDTAAASWTLGGMSQQEKRLQTSQILVRLTLAERQYIERGFAEAERLMREDQPWVTLPLGRWLIGLAAAETKRLTGLEMPPEKAPEKKVARPKARKRSKS
jgi:hypothetical protein